MLSLPRPDLSHHTVPQGAPPSMGVTGLTQPSPDVHQHCRREQGKEDFDAQRMTALHWSRLGMTLLVKTLGTAEGEEEPL